MKYYLFIYGFCKYTVILIWIETDKLIKYESFKRVIRDIGVIYFVIKIFHYKITILKLKFFYQSDMNRKKCMCNSPSLLIPTAMHFFSRQYWHRFLLILRILHCWFFVQGRYCIFCCIDRRKKPCGSQLHLVESLSTSELSSLEQPESLDSRRASSMLTSTECRSRNSAPHDMVRTIHYTRHWHHHSPRYWSRLWELSHALYRHEWRLRADCARCVAHRSYPRDLLAGRRPNRESESAP